MMDKLEHAGGLELKACGECRNIHFRVLPENSELPAYVLDCSPEAALVLLAMIQREIAALLLACPDMQERMQHAVAEIAAGRVPNDPHTLTAPEQNAPTTGTKQ